MGASSFKNNLRFALRKEALGIRENLPLNQIEKIGDYLSWFAYGFKDFCIDLFFDPRFVTVCFTVIAMILNSFLFYPTDAWEIASTAFKWLVEHTNWAYARFCLWAVCEVTIFGVGMRAFGRFSNQQLMKHYQEQELVI